MQVSTALPFCCCPDASRALVSSTLIDPHHIIAPTPLFLEQLCLLRASTSLNLSGTMTNSHPHQLDGPAEITGRLSSLHVDERFSPVPTNTHPHPPQGHHSPNPTGYTPSLGNSNRSFAYPDPAQIYDFYPTPLVPINGQLEPPFSPVHSVASTHGHGHPHGHAHGHGHAAFGFAPPLPGDMAGMLQNQFEYGQADPYGAAAAAAAGANASMGLGLGLGVGVDGVPISMRGSQIQGMGGGLVSLGASGGGGGYRRDGHAHPQARGLRGDEPRSQIDRTFRPADAGRMRIEQSQQQHQHQPGMGGQRGQGKMGDGRGGSPPQGFGGYGVNGYWPVNNGAFVERGKKSVVSPFPFASASPIKGQS